MAARIDPPGRPTGTLEAQVAYLYGYLQMLAEQIGFELNRNEAEIERLTEVSGKEERK